MRATRFVNFEMLIERLKAKLPQSIAVSAPLALQVDPLVSSPVSLEFALLSFALVLLLLLFSRESAQQGLARTRAASCCCYSSKFLASSSRSPDLDLILVFPK